MANFLCENEADVNPPRFMPAHPRLPSFFGRLRPAFLGLCVALGLSALAFVGVAFWPHQDPTHEPEIVYLKDGDLYEMTAAMVTHEIDGHELSMLAYNGSIPGPVLRVDQGSTITLRLHNELKTPTTLHSHGLRLDVNSDGVPGVTQAPIQPGDSFDYTLTFPDAGVFWYHPHLREDRDQELGLYGNFLVAAGDAQNWNPVDKEMALFVDDILLTENGEIASFEEEANHALMGRYGNIFLANGALRPTWTARQGEVLRVYLTNAANARPFRLTLPGARMKLVGGDNGLYEHETWTEALILGPSERAIVEIQFAEAGAFPLQNQTPVATDLVGTWLVEPNPTDLDSTVSNTAQAAFEILHTHDQLVQEMNLLREYLDETPEHEALMTLEMKMGGMSGMHHGGHGGHESMQTLTDSKDGIEWDDSMPMMNAMSTSSTLTWILRDLETGLENMDIHWFFEHGTLSKLRFKNASDSEHPMQHPLHFHGQRFVVLSMDGVPNSNMVWKDTVLVPSGSTVDILLENSNLGDWMAHCHIAEHLEAGMMLNFSVLER